MMFKLAFAALLLVSTINADGVKTSASNTRAYFVNQSPVARHAQASYVSSASQFRPAAVHPRAPAASATAAVRDLPVTSFNCATKPYIPGIYADEEANCEVFHVCTPNVTYSFACGEGTAFNQKLLTCDNPENVACSQTSQYYHTTNGIGQETGIVTPEVQKTSFTCKDKPFLPGLYADLEANCAIYHYCLEDQIHSFNCGEGTFFNQEKLTCDYPSEVNCAASPNFYNVNAGIGVSA